MGGMRINGGGGLEMARCSNDRGVESMFGEIEISHFLS